jgi:hypothetical protein
MNDLERAIVSSEKAMELISNDHPDRASCLNNFASALHARYESTGSAVDLDRYIATIELAVVLTPEDDPARPGCRECHS